MRTFAPSSTTQQLQHTALCRKQCRRQSRHCTRAIQSPEEVKTPSPTSNGNGKPLNGNTPHIYPDYEVAKPDESLLNLPVREPGSFPETIVHTPEAPRSFLESIIVDFSENASLDESAFDPLRDGPLRFCGYANEVGEAFAAWLPPGGVPASYALAISYVLVDTYDKGTKAYRRAKLELDARSDLDASVDKEALARLISTERSLDTVIWQLIASVAAPGYTIHTIVAVTLAALTWAEGIDTVQQAVQGACATLSLSPETTVALINKSLPTAVGLSAIPFIVHPIDNAVHALMNATLRPAMRQYVCSQGGAAAGLDICKEPFDGSQNGH